MKKIYAIHRDNYVPVYLKLMKCHKDAVISTLYEVNVYDANTDEYVDTITLDSINKVLKISVVALMDLLIEIDKNVRGVVEWWRC